MSAAPDAVAELDRLLLDDPYAEEIESAMTVAGDLLQSRGELRGEQIALEQALASDGDREARGAREARHAAWLDRHEAAVFGSLGALRHRAGAMRCEFRGGRLRSLFIDARHVTRGAEINARELMQVVVSSPKARWVSELRVRVRDGAAAGMALEGIRHAGRKLPLELLIISPTTRPLGHQMRGHATDLRKQFPYLWLVTRYAALTPLLDPELPDQTTAHALAEFAGAAMSRELRIRIGRGLTSGREHTTKVACELLAGLGHSARVFVPTLELLLRPQVSHAAAWIMPALPSLGPWVDALIPRVRRVTGDIANYPAELRRLAGHCLRDLERRPV